MNIRITYKLKNIDTIKSIYLTPEQYYDPIEKGQSFEENSIAKFGDTIDYITEFDVFVNAELIEYSLLEIMNSLKSDMKLKTTYFGNESELRYLKDSTGWELIVQSIKVTTNCIVITRMERNGIDSEWKCINFTTGINYINEEYGKEIWLSAHKGEYINHIIPSLP
jgi:hypothetical protein